MSKRINIVPNASPNGGVGVGVMTSAGNPWTVVDGLAYELVNRKLATLVDAEPESQQAVTLTPTQAAALPSLVGKFATRAPLPGVGGIGFSLADVVSVGGACTLTMETGSNGLPSLRVQAAAGVTVELNFPGMTNTISNGEAYLAIQGSWTQGNLDAVTSYVSQDAAGYAKGWSNSVNYGYATALNSPFEQGGVNTYWFRKGNNTPFGAPTYPAFVADHKVRLTARATFPLDCRIYAYGFAAPKPKSRILVTADDGYDSFMKLGLDSFASRGIPVTLSLIGSVVGTGGGYVNMNQLKAFLNAGNALVAHGPWPNSGAGNLFSAYPGAANPAAAALADMIQNREFLRSNGLLVDGADRCYVWPQGAWQQTQNDTSLLDLAIANGFTFGRSATPGNTFNNFDALSKYNRLCLPIVGHTWNAAGTTAGEATNIAAVIANINNAATYRGDCVLMLHRVLPSTTSDGGMGGGNQITIRHSDLEQLAAAIKTNIDAGTQEALTMPQVAVAPQTVWATA